MRSKIKRNNRNDRLPVYQIIFELGGLFGRECEVCGRKLKKPSSGFTIHHLEYRPKEKTHKDFSSRLEYYKYLKPIILKYANDKRRTVHDHHAFFAFLCNACHHSIDGPRGLNRRKKINVLRLFLLYFRTNT